MYPQLIKLCLHVTSCLLLDSCFSSCLSSLSIATARLPESFVLRCLESDKSDDPNFVTTHVKQFFYSWIYGICFSFTFAENLWLRISFLQATDNNVPPCLACFITYPISLLFLFEILCLALFSLEVQPVIELHLNDLKTVVTKEHRSASQRCDYQGKFYILQGWR